MTTLNLSPPDKALNSLRRALSRALATSDDDELRDACIQRFESVFELSWKRMNRQLREELVNPPELDAWSFKPQMPVGALPVCPGRSSSAVRETTKYAKSAKGPPAVRLSRIFAPFACFVVPLTCVFSGNGFFVQTGNAPSPVAGERGLIVDVEAWFDYRVKRNLTSHTHDERKAEQGVAILPRFRRMQQTCCPVYKPAMNDRSLDLEQRHEAMVLDILQRCVLGLGVCTFGSRVDGRARRYSDLDLVVITGHPLPPVTLHALQEAFEDSELPCRVDVVDWAATESGFREVIDACHVPLRQAIRGNRGRDASATRATMQGNTKGYGQ